MSAPLTLRRKLLYSAVLSGTLLALLLCGLELGLRLAGYGASPKYGARAQRFSRQIISPEGAVVRRKNSGEWP